MKLKPFDTWIAGSVAQKKGLNRVINFWWLTFGDISCQKNIYSKGREGKHEDQIYHPGIRTKDLKQTCDFQKVRIVNDFTEALENSQMY